MSTLKLKFVKNVEQKTGERAGEPRSLYIGVGWTKDEAEAYAAQKKADGFEGETLAEDGQPFVSTGRFAGTTCNMTRVESTGRFMIDRTEQDALANYIRQFGAEAGVILYKQSKGQL